MKRLGLLFVIGYTVSAGVAQAATYYVSKTGNNSNSCAQAQSISTPKQTLSGTSGALQCLSAGDTLFVRAGTYDESIDLRSTPMRSGTSWSSIIRVANYNGETVWLTPTTAEFVVFLRGSDRPLAYVEFDGINLDGRNRPNTVINLVGGSTGDVHHIRFKNARVLAPNAAGANAVIAGPAIGQSNGANGNEFINLTISGGGGGTLNGYGLYIASSNNLIEGCDISDNRGAGIHIWRDGGAPSNNIVRNNRVHDLTRSKDTRMFGITLAGNNNEIYNNLVYNIKYPDSGSNAGIYVFMGSGHKIWNNTVANNTADGINLASVSNIEVRNNIAYGNTGTAFVNSGTGTVESNNLFGVDPLFVNPAGNDFQVKTTSRAVDQGASLSAVKTDLVGTPRPQGPALDIGAFEQQSQQASAPPAPPSGVRIVN
jgi:parallel beta-helix repeat protein